MYRIGIAGFGFMGQMHIRAYREVSEAKVTALFDVDSAIFERGPTAGNIASGDLGDIASIAKFTDFDKFLAADVDAIDICVPTFLHRDLTERAVRSGRPVLCEKPMALNVADCDATLVSFRTSFPGSAELSRGRGERARRPRARRARARCAPSRCKRR